MTEKQIKAVERYHAGIEDMHCDNCPSNEACQRDEHKLCHYPIMEEVK